MAVADFNETFDSNLGGYDTVTGTVAYDGTTGSPSSGTAKMTRIISAQPIGASSMQNTSGSGTIVPADAKLNFKYRITGLNAYTDGNRTFFVDISVESGAADPITILNSDISSADTGWLAAPEFDLSANEGDELYSITFYATGIEVDSAPGNPPVYVYVDTITLTAGSPASVDIIASQAGIPGSILVA